ncbi:MAG: hypothetical protein S4CHLAM123_11070 [Chlamydiales bacterium]|nr:hypothetical protein [Chlamydiales bacterium]
MTISIEPELFQEILNEYPGRDSDELKIFFTQSVSRVAQQVLEDSAPVLVNNFLSAAWRFSYASEHPYEMPAVYFFGMVSFALALPVRVSLVALTALRSGYIFLQTLFKRQFHAIGKNMQESGLVFLGSLGELGSCVIGLVFPPLAYKIDELIQTNTTINTWYAKYTPTVWSDQIEMAYSLGNSNPLNLDDSSDELANDFWMGRHQLEKFIHPEELEGQMPEVLYKIAAAGFLHKMIRNSDSEEEITCDEKYRFISDHIDRNLEFSEDLVCSLWNCVTAIENRPDRRMCRLELINYIFYALALNTEQVNEIEDHFILGITTIEMLENYLLPLKGIKGVDMEGERVSLYRVVGEIASELLNLSSAIASEDRKFLGDMLQAFSDQ